LYLAYQVGGNNFVQDVFRMQIAGRMDSQYFPFYFYFTNSFANYAIAYPLALFAMLGVLLARKQLRDYPVLIQLVGWVLVILIGMSIPGEKKTRYILPFVPALALLAAYPLSVNIRQRYFIWLRTIISALLLFSPSLLFGLIMYITHIIVRMHLTTPVQSSLMTFFAVMQIAALILYVTVRTSQRTSIILICTLIVYFVAYFKIVEPLEFAIDSGRDFVTKVETLRIQKHAELVFYRESPDGLPIKYLVNVPQEVKPVFLKTYEELQAYRANAFFITTGAYYEELTTKQKRPFVIVESGKLGHVDLVVFRRKR
jgi:4-amino-4-deoxy-L-arabinose transferase-like glycosyltransferase